MSIICPPKYQGDFPDLNREFAALKGELTDKEAKITLAKFLRYNIGFTVELLTGMNLVSYQEAALKGWLNRNFSMAVWARGAAKSTMAAVASFLIPLFEPNTNILIAGPTFRTARNIFTALEKIVKSPEGILLQQAFAEKASKRADLFEWEINGGTIRAIPLNGEKIRGFRANVLILDEFLLLSEDIIKNVLMPFLVAATDMKERIKITTRENREIKMGRMKEEDRTKFVDRSRMIALSSASYTFENLYKVYTQWIDNIMSNAPIDKATYFVSQVSYEAVPEYMLEKTIIEEAKSGGQTEAAFQREYGAQFVDGSDSYFSAKKMYELTIKDGDRPTTMLVGNPLKKYILSIDPSFSNSPSSDYFAMAIGEINEDDNSIILVHNYAVAGGELKDHIRYFYYLLRSFNVVMIIADNADGNFIQSANESGLFQENRLELKFIDYDGDLINEDYFTMLRLVKNQYNQTDYKICFKHVFNSTSIRRINEQLQTAINTKKVWFASKLSSHEDAYAQATKLKLPYEFGPNESLVDLISTQDDLIYQVKTQCSLIEVKATSLGNQTFDLPAALKRSTAPNRARKDNYTALMLLVEGFKAYSEIMSQAIPVKRNGFIPRMFGKSTLR